ncbi:hypothetical protein [Williamsia deligens]|uniref:Uncharacterized protein n=1 Tax=Williamsia deligens TaxID=321325 RepID=A0ABW3G4Z9_9NOCA|nr:hypothetical protein [Williamsia deligens]MCP2193532.1 hypothetical protein [Williamsia deligens]
MSTPSWRVLRAKNYGTVGRTLHAHLRYANGQTSELWLDPPKREREERNGAPIYIASETETFRFPADADVVRTDLTQGQFAMMWAGAHHSRLFGAHRRWPFEDRGGFDIGQPTSITEATHQGRPAWEVTFPHGPHRSGPQETFIIDDASGLVLRWTDGTDHLEVMSFVLDEELDDSLFTWSGPFITHEDETAQMMQRNEELQARIADIPLSRPAWMPSEITVSRTDGDPETGSLTMSVSVTAPYVTVRRWLTRLPQPEPSFGFRAPESHSISDGTWTHELRWQTDALTVADAERILRSIPPVGSEDDAADVVARVQEEAENSRRELESPGSALTTGIVYSGPVDVAYHQYYLATQDDWSGDYWASFVGQRNGLVGTADPACIPLNSGLHTGDIDVTLEVSQEQPPLDTDGWEDIVEAPLTVDSPLFLNGWGTGEPGVELPLARGTYRLRYSANGMDAAAEADTGSGIDRYLITIWPAPASADEVVKQTSDAARYQHDHTRTLTAPDPSLQNTGTGVEDASVRLSGPVTWPSD